MTHEVSGRDLSWFNETPKKQGRNILKAGVYSGCLTKIKAGLGKAYNGEEPRKTITFFFELTCGEVVVRTVGASTSLKSQCMALVNELSEHKPLSLSAMVKPDLLQAHILSLIGTDYSLVIEPSNCGRFNNIIKVGKASCARGPYAV